MLETTQAPTGDIDARMASYTGVRSILAVLEADVAHRQPVLDAAVRLAGDQRARLTLAQLCDPGRVYVWFGGDVYLPVGSEPATAASRQLARVASTVPTDISLTTMVLYNNCRRRVRNLVRSSSFDTVVATSTRLNRDPLLCSDISRLGIHEFAVTALTPGLRS